MIQVSRATAHELKGFGTVHCVEVPHYGPGLRAFPLLHSFCGSTPCNAMSVPVNQYLSPHELKLINRTHNQGASICMSKTADGMLFHIGNRLIAGIHGKSFYDQDSTDPVKLFSIEDSHPHIPSSHFSVVFHDNACDVHELSRHSITEHVLAQIKALQPPCPKGTPQVIFQSPKIGAFSSRVLKGPPVHALKTSFLELIDQMAQKGDGVYNRTIRLKPEFSKLLMLKHAAGNILCDRCHDGIVGYRIRPHNQKKTFVFVANSNDFHAFAPSHPDQSMLQVMKMDYADTSKKGLRIVIRDEDDKEVAPYGVPSFEQEEDDDDDEAQGEEDDEEEDGFPVFYISLRMTVQEIINAIELHFRNCMLKEHECHLFPRYCQLLAQKQRQAEIDQVSSRFYNVLGG